MQGPLCGPFHMIGLYSGPCRNLTPSLYEQPMTNSAGTLQQLQDLIAKMYSDKDTARGPEGTFMWLMEEVGELAAALREGTPEELAAEFADVLAWLATLANVMNVDLTSAVQRKYGSGCPGCGEMVCSCNVKP